MSALMIDDHDPRFAVADMPDGTWKLYERLDDDLRPDRLQHGPVFTEIDHLPSFEHIIGAMKQQQQYYDVQTARLHRAAP